MQTAERLAQELICPITHTIPYDPVVAPDGCIYERSAIEQWMQRTDKKSPVTNLPMPSCTLLSVPSLRNCCETLANAGHADASSRWHEDLHDATHVVAVRHTEKGLLPLLRRTHSHSNRFQNKHFTVFQNEQRWYIFDESQKRWMPLPVSQIVSGHEVVRLRRAVPARILVQTAGFGGLYLKDLELVQDYPVFRNSVSGVVLCHYAAVNAWVFSDREQVHLVAQSNEFDPCRVSQWLDAWHSTVECRLVDVQHAGDVFWHCHEVLESVLPVDGASS